MNVSQVADIHAHKHSTSCCKYDVAVSCPPLAAACTSSNSSPDLSPVIAAKSFSLQLSVQAKHKIHYALQLIFRLRLRSGKGRRGGWGMGDNRLHKYPRRSETIVTEDLGKFSAPIRVPNIRCIITRFTDRCN